MHLCKYTIMTTQKKAYKFLEYIFNFLLLLVTNHNHKICFLLSILLYSWFEEGGCKNRARWRVGVGEIAGRVG